MILLSGFFLSILCMLPITTNTKKVCQSVYCLWRGCKVTVWTAINLCVWNPITASVLGLIQTHRLVKMSYFLFPVCTECFLYLRASVSPSGQTHWLFIYFQTSAAGHVKDKKLHECCENRERSYFRYPQDYLHWRYLQLCGVSVV